MFKFIYKKKPTSENCINSGYYKFWANSLFKDLLEAACFSNEDSLILIC